MSHPYLKFTLSDTYPFKFVVGKTARALPYGDGLTDTSVTVVEIPSSFNGIEVAEIGHLSFYQKSLITSVFIQKTVCRICQEAFESCTKLTDVRFEAGSKLQILDYAAFYYCTSLKKIDFPASVSTINNLSYFFHDVSLDCFSYAGTVDFSSLLSSFFSSVTTIYVPNDYKGSTFAGKTITRSTQTCGVSKSHLETPNTGTNKAHKCKVSFCFQRSSIPFHYCMLLLIQSHF